MIVQCDKCATKYKVPEEKVPAAGIKAQCKACGHIVTVYRPTPGEPLEQVTLSPIPSQEPWQCVCGAHNAPELDDCETCKRSKKLFAGIPAKPEPPGPVARQASGEETRSAPIATWRSLLLVGASAAILGVGISYLLGHVLNRSLAMFFSSIFK